jgi:hypothetical protein
MKSLNLFIRSSAAVLCAAVLTQNSPCFGQVTPTPQPTSTPVPFQSQSWLRMQNGNFITLSGLATPTLGASLFEHESILPSASAVGSNFSLYRVGTQWKVAVVDHRGQLYIYDFATPAARTGGVYYFAEKTHELIAVDSHGSYLPTTLTFENATLLGGNYFFDSTGTLHTVRASGIAPWNWAGMVSSKTGFQIPRPKLMGGVFFTTEANQVITISSETGFFSDPKNLPDGEIPFLLGGNYWVTQKLNLYTVDFQGEIRFLKKLAGKPLLNGYSYLIMPGNKLNVIDAAGNLLEHSTVRDRSGSAKKLESLAPSAIQSQSVSDFGGVK